MTDIRFPTALQIMLTLANSERLGFPLVTSAQLARGVGSTASLVRRLLVPLGHDGIVRASLGKSGGVRLARPAADITLGDIYTSVVGDKQLLVARAKVPHLCDVSSRVEGYFASLAAEADAAVVGMLRGRTLEQSLSDLLTLEHTQSRRRDARATRAESRGTHATGTKRREAHVAGAPKPLDGNVAATHSSDANVAGTKPRGAYVAATSKARR